jgi:hypothetical protein
MPETPLAGHGIAVVVILQLAQEAKPILRKSCKSITHSFGYTGSKGCVQGAKCDV